MSERDRIGADAVRPVNASVSSDRSLGELFGELTHDLSDLFHKEVELAKVETKEEASRAGKAVAAMAVGGLVLYLALIMLSFAVAWWLDQAINRGLAFLIVAVVHGILGYVLLNRGRKQMKDVDPVPRQTVQTIKEMKEITQ